MSVYFVQVGKDGPIKIGTTHGDPRGRLGALQTSHHETLVLLGSISGGVNVEGVWQHRFKALRLRGEWFRAAPELLAAIAEATREGKPQKVRPVTPPPDPKIPRDPTQGFDCGEPVAVVRAWGLAYLAARDRGLDTRSAWRAAEEAQSRQAPGSPI